MLKVFEIHRYHIGKEISGIELLGIRIDFRTWYLVKANKKTIKKHPFLVDKNGWYDSWSTPKEVKGIHKERLKKIPFFWHFKCYPPLYNRFVFTALVLGFLVGKFL